MCWSSKKTKARKNHPCAYCQLEIYKGTSYIREKGIGDGQCFDYGWHLECEFHFKKTHKPGDYLPVFKVPRSEPYLYALRHGSKELQDEIRDNLKTESNI